MQKLLGSCLLQSPNRLRQHGSLTSIGDSLQQYAIL